MSEQVVQRALPRWRVSACDGAPPHHESPGAPGRRHETYGRRRAVSTHAYPELGSGQKQDMARQTPSWPKRQHIGADDGHCAVVRVYSNHLPCLFPQHGPGKKHERAIVLESWQQEIVDAILRVFFGPMEQ